MLKSCLKGLRGQGRILLKRKRGFVWGRGEGQSYEESAKPSLLPLACPSKIEMKKSIGAKTIIFPTPVLVVGTYDKSGKPNLMTAAWGGICCSRPPCVAISLRKATYTYGNIIERKAFTVNILSENHVKEADYYGIATGRDEEKFSTTGITPVKSNLVDAPYGEEFPMFLECSLLQTVEIGLHTQFIGEIMDIKAEEEVLGDNGVPDIKRVKSFLFDPANRNYYGFGRYLGRAFSIGKELKS